jgi:hypothetical protein
MFASAWSLVSKVLPARTAKKIRFVSFQDTPSTLMRYIEPASIVALQRLSWGDDGDVIADDINRLKLERECAALQGFPRKIEVPARGSAQIFVSLESNQKCSFRILDLDDTSKDTTGFAEVLFVPSDQSSGVDPDHVEVEAQTCSSKGSASCPSGAKSCLVVLAIDANSWFSSRCYEVDVRIFD